MLRLEISAQADADLVGILEYGAAAHGLDAAAAYVAGFDESFERLCKYLEIGAVHPETRPPIRSWPHHSHRIFYDVDAVRVVIQRIMHKSVDVVRWLG